MPPGSTCGCRTRPATCHTAVCPASDSATHPGHGSYRGNPAGIGGDVGPALDRLGWKVSHSWLVAALSDSATQGLSPESHPYVLSVRDATDLSAFLVRRFSPPGGPAQDVTVITTDVAAGLSEALMQGCFECHQVRDLKGPPLPLPVTTGRATAWLGYHKIARGAVPSVPLAPAEIKAMATALVGSVASDPPSLPPFWDLPIDDQGDPPELFAAGQRLEPAACGQCHSQQMEGWSQSRHAAAFSPGLWAQLADAPTAFVEECLSCHTPMREQIDRALALQQDATTMAPDGIDCAGCHVRAHRYYGPGQPGSQDHLVAQTIEVTHHGGAVAAPELFGADAFCAPCHQFDADGLSLEGKLLQDTYGEWRNSPAARKGQTCQSCHMPGGDHHIRGLHDRNFVRNALEFDTDWHAGPGASGLLRVSLRNVGARHALPTYATGALHVKIFLSDDHDGVIESSLRTRSVQRRLTVDGQRELFDTRIPAGGLWRYEQNLEVLPEARFVNVLVEVDPDHFYRRFFALLEPSGPRTRALLQQARGRISDSPYILFAR